MYKRKIEDKLQAWFVDPSHKPVVVKGVRQCGNYNIGRKDKLLTMPMYMAFLLTERVW